MNDGIKILLERMKTHPEEFDDDGSPFSYEGKWKGIFDKFKHNLDPEDKQAFEEAFNKLRQEKFTAEVMAELLNPKQEEQLTLSPTKRPSATLQAGQTLGAYSNTATITSTLQAQQAVQNTTLHDLLHQKALRELKTTFPTVKKHETLFGKLKNYLHSDT